MLVLIATVHTAFRYIHVLNPVSSMLQSSLRGRDSVPVSSAPRIALQLRLNVPAAPGDRRRGRHRLPLSGPLLLRWLVSAKTLVLTPLCSRYLVLACFGFRVALWDLRRGSPARRPEIRSTKYRMCPRRCAVNIGRTREDSRTRAKKYGIFLTVLHRRALL